MDEETRERLEAIEARLDAMERRPPERATMKERRRCPSCGGAKLLHTARLRADIQAGVPFGMSIQVPAWGRAKARGIFEVFACIGCGLVEWHALGLDSSLTDDENLALVAPPDEDDAGPYR